MSQIPIFDTLRHQNMGVCGKLCGVVDNLVNYVKLIQLIEFCRINHVDYLPQVNYNNFKCDEQ